MIKFHNILKKQTRETGRKDMSSNDKKIAAQKSDTPLNTAFPSAEKNHLSKATSPAKVAANRLNAQKSTGPKTSAGKNHSRWNAVKHGILSKNLVIGSEAKDAFALQLASLCEQLQPESVLEEILVEQIAISYWRLHLAFACEADFVGSGFNFIVGKADPVVRYSNSIHRQLIQNMNQLERLQRQRRGDAVPPPVSIDVNVAGLAPHAYFETLHDFGKTYGTAQVNLATEADDSSLAKCHQTAPSPEPQDTKGLSLQHVGPAISDSDSTGATLELEKHHASVGDTIPDMPGWSAGKSHELLPNEPKAGSVAELGG
jgi:hypothetical protein